MTTKKYSLEEFQDSLTFGDFVRSIRKSDSITQEQLAAKMNCSKQYISGIETGRDCATMEVAKKIAEALGYSASPFLEILLNEMVSKIDPGVKIEVKPKKAA